MQRRIFFRTPLTAFLIIIALAGVSRGQHRRGYPTPPTAAAPDNPPATPQNRPPRADSVDMEREAKEMAALANSIPGDVEQMKKGLLPSAAFDKLKRIEKLSKQLRSQMRP